MIAPNDRQGSNPDAGEVRGQGFVVSLDEDAGLIRLKMRGEWKDLDVQRARGLADLLEGMDIEAPPRAYDVQGRFIGSAIERLREFAAELEELEADQ